MSYMGAFIYMQWFDKTDYTDAEKACMFSNNKSRVGFESQEQYRLIEINVFYSQIIGLFAYIIWAKTYSFLKYFFASENFDQTDPYW